VLYIRILDLRESYNDPDGESDVRSPIARWLSIPLLRAHRRSA